MITALILIPLLAGVASFLLRNETLRRGLLVSTALAHSLLTAVAWWRRPAGAPDAWLALDAPGLLFLGITSLLFLAASVYALGYLRRESRSTHADFEENFLFVNEPEAVFIGCLLLFLAAMTLVTVSRHLGLLWVAVEATTLASAPLIYFHRHHRSLEATWKYLLVCSVGIALALLGNFFLGVAATAAGTGGQPLPLNLDELLRGAARLQTPWLKASFILMLVGYGTKMGLAPLHTWLPDAHSESPSVVSALLSGAVLNCAFLGILRAYQVCHAAGQDAFAQDLLIGLGLVSLGVAAAFILGQTDYKRLLAYSSVEHMGLLALGLGLGGGGAFGAMLHTVNHSLTKAMLFLVAGVILAIYQTKQTGEVRGVLRAVPLAGVLWFAGFFAISGMPPFGLFLSEFAILKAAFTQGHTVVAVVSLFFLAVVFIAMGKVFINMAQGPAPPARQPVKAENLGLLLGPPTLLGAMVLVLGLYVPPALEVLLNDAARALGGSL